MIRLLTAIWLLFLILACVLARLMFLATVPLAWLGVLELLIEASILVSDLDSAAGRAWSSLRGD